MKILVVRIGRAGDMVMITAAINALTHQYPDAEISILTSPDGRRILNDFHPRIKNIWVLHRKKIFPFLERYQIRRVIKQTCFNHIFCFENKLSFRKLFIGSTAQLHILQNMNNKEMNFAERCLHLVDPTANNEIYPVYLPVKSSAILQSDKILQKVGIQKSVFLIGMHPSFSGLSKSFGRKGKFYTHKFWPEQHWAQLSFLLSEYAKSKNIEIKMIIDLLPEEEALGQRIVNMSNNIITLLMPPPNFERYKATLSRMNILITPNTGPAHIAAAVGTNLVALFSGHDPKDCAPYACKSKIAILRAEDSFNPTLGLAAISAEDVLQACKGFLA